MSMPDAEFVCMNCDVVLGRLHGPRRNTNYLYEGMELPMEWCLGYCPGCDKIGRLKEYLPSKEELCQRRVKYIKGVSGFKNFLAGLFSSRARKRKTDYLTKIKELDVLKDFLGYRRGNELCYECGGRDVVPLNFKSTLKYGYESMYYQGEQDIGFEHPGCGGKVLLKTMNMRFMYAWPDKVLFDETGIRWSPIE